MLLDAPAIVETSDLPRGTIALGHGEPLILLHGVMGATSMWRETFPLLATSQRVIALPALGHQAGRPCETRPCRIEHVTDDVERSLDALGIQRAHIAGNSMGGWLALELARRGRARSVCALSPAGMWISTKHFAGAKKLRATASLTRATRKSLPLVSKLAALRRFALRDTALHGERVTSSVLIELADALLECTVGADLLATPEAFQPLQLDNPASCPIDIAWSQEDRIFPLHPFADSARQRVPSARHLVLEDVGHVPMLDNPTLVARTILNTIARCSDFKPL